MKNLSDEVLQENKTTDEDADDAAAADEIESESSQRLLLYPLRPLPQTQNTSNNFETRLKATEEAQAQAQAQAQTHSPQT